MLLDVFWSYFTAQNIEFILEMVVEGNFFKTLSKWWLVRSCWTTHVLGLQNCLFAVIFFFFFLIFLFKNITKGNV